MADPQRISLDTGNGFINVTISRSARAKRISLRLDPVRGPVLVIPVGGSLAKAQAFLAAHRGWLAQRLAHQPQPIFLADGISLPLAGMAHVVRHHASARRGVWAEDGIIWVSGAADHLPRRLMDFLKAQAKRRITAKVTHIAQALQVRHSRVTVKDTRSRWGSCSSDGRLAFSWRLVLAPTWVMDYVIAHELSHLRHMDHSDRFWQTVASVNGDAHAARTWLKTHGATLHLYRLAGADDTDT